MKQVTMNFGAIKDTVYRYASKNLVYEHKEEISILNAFLNEIKKNPLLKLQFIIYKNLEEGFCKNDSMAERFINQNMKLIEGYSWNEIGDLNKSVRYSLLEQSHVEGKSGQEEFYEAVHALIKSNTQKGYTDISKSQEAYDFLIKHLTTPKSNIATEQNLEEEYPKFLSWKFVTELAVNNFNERYSHLNEEEKSLLKTLMLPIENKKNAFIDLKEENLELIKQVSLDNQTETISDTLKSFVDKINSLNENFINDSDLDEAIIHLVELKNTILEIQQV